MPYMLPEVLRRNSQLRNGTAIPIQCLGDPLQSVEKMACSRRSDRADGGVGHQKVIKNETDRGGEKRRERDGRRDEQLEKMGGRGVRRGAKMLSHFTVPSRSSFCKSATKVSLREKAQSGCNQIVCEKVRKLDSSRVPFRVGLWEWESERIVDCPVVHIGVPMRA